MQCAATLARPGHPGVSGAPAPLGTSHPRYPPAVAARVSPDAPRKGATLAYLPALDGIRGVAMFAIMGVHGGVS